MAAGLQARALQLQPQALVPSMVTIAAAPPAPSGWSLETPGLLMSLESAATAFDQLAVSGSAAAAAQSAAAAASLASQPLALLQGSDSGMNLFIAAAIVGPCAAFRPLGHTPGGW
jgi:hypothetical protein